MTNSSTPIQADTRPSSEGTTPAVPRFGLVIVGDEILSGKRADKHLPKVIELLQARGLTLDYAEYVGDSPQRITDTLARAFASGDVVFSTGGIGATPDDHTRQCAARALGVELALHPQAAELIREIERDGPRAVLRRHFDTLAWTNVILPGIKAASDERLTVAELLQLSADAGGARDLDSALYAALPVRPFSVIRVLEKKCQRPASYLCNVSFEAEVHEGGALPYLQRLKR